MQRLTAEVIDAIQDLIDADRALREALRRNERILARAQKSLRSGMSIEAAFSANPSTEARATANEALEAVVRARHQVRVKVVKAGRSEGMSLGELARQLNFSRQLCSRYGKEAELEPFASVEEAGVLTYSR